MTGGFCFGKDHHVRSETRSRKADEKRRAQSTLGRLYLHTYKEKVHRNSRDTALTFPIQFLPTNSDSYV